MQRAARTKKKGLKNDCFHDLTGVYVLRINVCEKEKKLKADHEQESRTKAQHADQEQNRTVAFFGSKRQKEANVN